MDATPTATTPQAESGQPPRGPGPVARFLDLETHPPTKREIVQWFVIAVVAASDPAMGSTLHVLLAGTSAFAGAALILWRTLP